MALDTLPTRDVHAEARNELRQGLLSEQRFINPKFFYDERGSQLFSEICDLPEYYPTRAEREILSEHAAEIAGTIGPGCQLIEPGAGSCAKVRLLLGELLPASYLPLDISADYLMDAAEALGRDFPDVPVIPLVGDFSREFDLPVAPGSQRVLFYPGSTIGNFTPEQASDFLQRVAKLVGEEGGLLIGVDLHKRTEILDAAYNDTRGLTADFNLNILSHCNRLLQSDFNPGAFDHLAFYNEPERRIEMHLVSREEQRVRGTDLDIVLAPGERIHTEYSYKYSLAGFDSLAREAGFKREDYWLDAEGLFSLQYFVVSPD